MRAIRATAAIAVLALVVGACGGGTATTAPLSAASAAPSAASSEAAASPGDSASAPANTPIAINGSTPAPGQTEIRWYCCLGGGDAPEQVDVEKKVVEEFNASHPNIHLTFEAVPYAGANDALATEIASGNGPDIVGPVGIGGANAFHGQWLDLAPLIAKNELRPVGVPAGRGQHLQARRGPGRDPVRDLPVGAVLRQEPVRRGRPRVPAAQVRRAVHDARRHQGRLELRHDPPGRQDPDRRQERQGRDAGRIRPDATSSSGASSPSATTCAAWAPTSAPARWPPRTARPPRSPTRGRRPGSSGTTACGPTTRA